MFIYYESHEKFYNYLLLKNQELKLADMSLDMLKYVTAVKTYQNLALGRVDRSTVNISLVLEEILGEEKQNVLQDIMKDSRLQTVKINRYCYISSYVEYSRMACVHESEKLLNRLKEILTANDIKHRFSIETCWGCLDEGIYTTNFFPENTRCDWYTNLCEYYPETEAMFRRCLTAALIGAQATVYYNEEYDTDKTIKYLIDRNIYTDVETIKEKIDKYTLQVLI